MGSLIFGFIILGLILGLIFIFKSLSSRFKENLKNNIKNEVITPIENTNIYKKQLSIMVKKIKKRKPDNKNDRLNSVE